MLKNKILASSLASLLMAATLLFTSCVPENVSPDADLPEGAILLKSENFRGADGTKLGVDAEGANVHFIAGDSLWVNGAVYPVRVTGNGRAYISRTDNESHFDNSIDGQAIRAVYPARIVHTDYVYTPGASTVDLAFPSLYHYRKDPTTRRQNVAAPLIAYAGANSNSIQFKHLTAAITVAVKNQTGVKMRLEKIRISDVANDGLGYIALAIDKYPRGISFSNPEVTGIGKDEDNTSVTLDVEFDIDTCDIEPNECAYVQVPVLPLIHPTNSNNKPRLKIEVLAKNMLPGVIANKFYYERTQESSGFDLVQNDLAYAPTTMAIDGDESQYLKVDGTFTIAELNGKKFKVYFSKGNLRYFGGQVDANTGDVDVSVYPSTSDSANWAFAENQYDVFESSTELLNTKVNTFGKNGWVSLFLYGATGKNTSVSKSHHPIASPRMEANNHSFATLTRSDSTDWGVRMGDGWFTLSKDQWTYLLSRPNTTNNNNVMYNHGTSVQGTKGMLIYPDKYGSGAMGTCSVQGIQPNPANAASVDDWLKYENAGVAFLPVTGHLQYYNDRRQGDVVRLLEKTVKGYYWTATGKPESNPYYVSFSSGSSSSSSSISYTPIPPATYTASGIATNSYVKKSFAVRLVYPANFTYDELQNAQSK